MIRIDYFYLYLSLLREKQSFLSGCLWFEARRSNEVVFGRYRYTKYTHSHTHTSEWTQCENYKKEFKQQQNICGECQYADILIFVSLFFFPFLSVANTDREC